jgi:hypothetical protein
LLRLVEGDTEKTTINGSERTITNGTDDDGKSYVQNGKAKITSDTDDFGRTSKVTTSIKNGNDFVDKFNLNYTYKTVGETHRTTNNVDEMTYKLGEGENATQIAKNLKTNFTHDTMDYTYEYKVYGKDKGQEKVIYKDSRNISLCIELQGLNWVIVSAKEIF